MKQLMRTSLLCALISLMSCNEDEELRTERNVEQTEKKVTVFQMPASPNARVNFDGKMLSFRDENEFYETIAYLDRLVDEHENYIETVLGDAETEEEINQIYETNNLDENQPYIDFEKQYGFYSLRKKMYDNETEWLENMGEEFDEAGDPSLNEPIWDPTEQTLLNENREVMIAGKIYRFAPWGKVEIRNQDSEGYYTFYDENSTTSNPNVTIEVDERGYIGTCRTSQHNVQYFTLSSSRRMRVQASLQRARPGRINRYFAKTTYYRWSSWFGWVRNRGNLHVSLAGQTYRWYCGHDIKNISEGKNRRTKSVFVRVRNFNANFEFYLGDNLVFSTHKVNDFPQRRKDFYDGQLVQ